jgi:ActR/RegA family two-component response regulator
MRRQEKKAERAECIRREQGKSSMTYTSLLIVDRKSSRFTVRVALEQRYDVDVKHAQDISAALEVINNSTPEYVLVNPAGIQVEHLLSQVEQSGKTMPVLVVGDEAITNNLRAIYPHIIGCVPPAYKEEDLLPYLQRQRLTQTSRLRGMALAERAALVQANQLLERRVQEVMALHQIGKAVASLTDLDVILTRIVEAAVYLLRAEEGSIMLVDPATNALYLRAEKGLGEKQARGFNVKIQDSLIGSVVRTGQSVKLARGTSNDSRLKVVTGYLVNALLYVPLTLRGQVIGVLGVSNQTAHHAFGEHDQRLMESLSDYAALAIEVARQHKTIMQMSQDLQVSHTIAAAVNELEEKIDTDDPDTLKLLRRLKGAAQILTRLSKGEAQINV